jgi:Uncharacterized conserved protein (DUF2190)
LSFDTIIPYAAAVDLSAQLLYCVKDVGGLAAPMTADTDVPIGILQNTPPAGGSCTLATHGVWKGILGGTVAKGDFVGPDATGALVKRTHADVGKYVIGRAGTSGAAGEAIPVRLTPVPFLAAVAIA